MHSDVWLIKITEDSSVSANKTFLYLFPRCLMMMFMFVLLFLLLLLALYLLLVSLLYFYVLLDVQPHRRANGVAYARIHGSRLPTAVAAAAQRWRSHRKLWTAKRVRRRRASSRTAMLALMRKIGCQMGIYIYLYLNLWLARHMLLPHMTINTLTHSLTHSLIHSFYSYNTLVRLNAHSQQKFGALGIG